MGFAGLDCSVPFPCPANCSGNGQCVHGKCYCDAAHAGYDCSHKLVCNNSCTDHGVVGDLSEVFFS